MRMNKANVREVSGEVREKIRKNFFLSIFGGLIDRLEENTVQNPLKLSQNQFKINLGGKFNYKLSGNFFL